MFRHTPLILASGSPRRQELMRQAGYRFETQPASPAAECGVCSRETAPEMVARLALAKARDVAAGRQHGLIVGCDTVACCRGLILGKPVDRQDARRMLTLLSGRPHEVYSGLCVWRRPDNHLEAAVEMTRLEMAELSPQEIDDYLDTGLWEGKAGAFGYQDRHDWLRVVEGEEDNVVGLPMARLAELLAACDAAPPAER